MRPAGQTARAARRTGHPRLSGAARAATARCRFIRRRIVRFFLLRGVDGQFSFRAADGTVRTLGYVRGVIESVSNGTSVVVQAADGSSWAWQLVSTTVVRDGERQDQPVLARRWRAGLGRRAGGQRGEGRPAHLRPAAQWVSQATRLPASRGPGRGRR